MSRRAARRARLAGRPSRSSSRAALHELLARGRRAGARPGRWAAGDRAPGLALWRQLAGLGVTALAVPERGGGARRQPARPGRRLRGTGASRGARPGGRVARRGPGAAGRRWPRRPTRPDAGAGAGLAAPALAAGDLIATLAAAAAAAVRGGRRRGRPGAAGRAAARSGWPAPGPSTGRWTRPGRCPRSQPAERAGQRRRDAGRRRAGPCSSARWPARPSCSARAARCWRPACGTPAQRAQFGQPVGAFQAVKHQLADVAIGLEFARPLLDAAAAVALGGGASRPPRRDVSAAKVACADAAHRAARTALQVHGAIGYTEEHDLSLWLTKVRALVPAWGSQAEHRAVVLAALDRPDGAGERTPGAARSTRPPSSGRSATRCAACWPGTRNQPTATGRGRPGAVAAVVRGDRRGRAGHPRALRRRGRRAGGDAHRGRGTRPRPHPLPAARLRRAGRAGCCWPAGDDAACQRLLPGIADGSVLAAVAWAGPAGHWDPAEAACTRRGTRAAGWRLDGEAHYVLDGDTADRAAGRGPHPGRHRAVRGGPAPGRRSPDGRDRDGHDPAGGRRSARWGGRAADRDGCWPAGAGPRPGSGLHRAERRAGRARRSRRWS